MTFETFLIVVTLLYVAQGVMFIVGLRRTPDAASDNQPFVSVVIAARDEARNIGSCLRSVLAQSYAADRYEVILADDGSSDGTAEIAERTAHGDARFRLLEVVPDERLPGKAGALAQAIDLARGEVVLITDADCVVPPTWVESTAKRYAADVGLVGGVTLHHAARAFEGMQSLDWAYILGMAASMAGFGYPLGSIGNNLSFRKSAYDAVGGYRALKFSVTEDYTLVQAIVRLKRWRYLYPIDPSILVETQPCPTISSLMRQKHRWGRGGLDMRWGGLLIGLIGYAAHAAPLVMLWWGGVVAAATALLVKSIVDYAYLYSILRRLDRVSDLKYFWWFELYFMAYVLALPFLVFFGGRVRWKGRAF